MCGKAPRSELTRGTTSASPLLKTTTTPRPSTPRIKHMSADRSPLTGTSGGKRTAGMYHHTESSEDDDHGTNQPAKRPRNFIARLVSFGPSIARICQPVLIWQTRLAKHAELERPDAIKKHLAACASPRAFSACTWKESLPG